MLYQSFDELMGIFTVGYTRGFTHANINQILGYNRTDPIQEIEACYERITDSINAIGDHPHLTPANIRILSLQALRGSQDRIASFVEKAEERQDSSPLPRWASNSLHQRTTDPEVEQKTLGTISRLKDIFGSDIGNTVATQCAVYYPTQCEALIEASYTESGAANALRQAREAQARIDLRRQAGKKPLPYDVLLVLDGRRAEKMQQQPMGAQLTAAIARGRSAQSRIDQAGAKGKKPRQQDLDLAAKGTKAKQTLITLDARTPSPAANACTPLTDVNPAVNERRRQFFFAEERTTDEDYAKALCMACDLVERCREEGVTRGEVGIWGGTNNSERRGLLRQRVTAVLTGKRDDPTLRIAIDSVSDQSRVVLELKSQGLTNSQIAEKIGSNVTNVANTYTNGIDQLTNSLRAQYDEEAIGQIAAIAAELQAAKA
jgi:DNA-binding CsgD family transcriptional regulator